MSDKRSRGWCFTINNYFEIDCAILMELYYETSMSYLILGFEIAPTTETRHIQGYMYFDEAKSFSYVTKLLPGVHFEAQKSKANVKAYCYCMEDGDYFELGERPRQGHRTDLEVIKHDLMTKKKDIKQVSREYFSQYCQYSRQFRSFIDMHRLEEFDTQILVYDEDTIDKVYSYDMLNALVYKSQYDFTKVSLLHDFYSKKYKYIFIPVYEGIEQLPQDLISTLY